MISFKEFCGDKITENNITEEQDFSDEFKLVFNYLETIKKAGWKYTINGNDNNFTIYIQPKKFAFITIGNIEVIVENSKIVYMGDGLAPKKQISILISDIKSTEIISARDDIKTIKTEIDQLDKVLSTIDVLFKYIRGMYE